MRVVREIAGGGFGKVEEVETDNGTRVARKVFRPDPDLARELGEDKLKQRFKREVRTQRCLSGDFFIPVLESGLDSDPAWFTMPLAEKTYSDQIAEDRTSGLPTVGPLTDILGSLEELHRLDYVHRDLKPQNILFHDGRWKLADFGLVLPPMPETISVTRTNQWFGTEKYMAPEQNSDFHNVNALSDIYSFGCILHDLVTSGIRTPYHEHTGPLPLGPIIEKCTQRDPRKRFKNVKTLREALLHALSKGVQLTPDALTLEWETELESLDSWEPEKVMALFRYLESSVHWGMFRALDEERIARLCSLNRDAWQAFGLNYCEWAGDFGFDFEYCDVIVGRLEKIFELGSPRLKSASLIAMAKLGAGHNRWFVMRRLLNLCGSTMEPTVAERLSIEIIAEDVPAKFVRCVEGIGRARSAYHPAIQEVLP